MTHRLPGMAGLLFTLLAGLVGPAAADEVCVIDDTDSEACLAAQRLRQGLSELSARHADAPPVTVFYQVWDSPLMTVNDEHLIGKVVTLCGGENVFGGLSRLVPRIDEEALLAADPEVIPAGGRGEENRSWLEYWQRFPELTAVARDNGPGGPGARRRPGQRRRRLAHRALARLDLAALGGRQVATLSGGERQRLAIATLLAQDPGVWLADEPTNHLDLHHQVAVMRLLAEPEPVTR